MSTFKSEKQTEMALTRVSLAPHEDGYFWRGEVDGRRNKNWEWEILKDEEVLSLSYVIECIEKEFDNVHITIRVYINSNIGYKIIPTHIYLSHCDKGHSKLREELLKYSVKDQRKKVRRKKVQEKSDFTFLMLDKE